MNVLALMTTITLYSLGPCCGTAAQRVNHSEQNKINTIQSRSCVLKRAAAKALGTSAKKHPWRAPPATSQNVMCCVFGDYCLLLLAYYCL